MVWFCLRERETKDDSPPVPGNARGRRLALPGTKVFKLTGFAYSIACPFWTGNLEHEKDGRSYSFGHDDKEC